MRNTRLLGLIVLAAAASAALLTCDRIDSRSELLARKDILDLLMKAHATLRQDILMHVGGIKNRVKNTQVGLTILISVLFGFVSTGEFALSDDTKYSWIVLALATTTLTYFLLYDVSSSIFANDVLGAMLASIEKRVNAIANQNILIWDTIAPTFWRSPVPFPGVIEPGWLSVFYSWILVFATTVAFPLYVYYAAWEQSSGGVTIATVVMLSGLYSISSGCLALYVLRSIGATRSHARKVIDRAWAAELPTNL